MASTNRLSPRRRVPLALAAAIASCLAVVACSDPSSPTPQVMLNSNIGLGTHSSADCTLAPGAWAVIGDNSKLIPDGDTYTPAGEETPLPVAVACSVVPANGVFQVVASATLGGGTDAASGTVTISGSFTATGVQTGITASFVKGVSGYGTLTETDCTVTFTAGTNQAVKAGAIWGMLDCPNITDPSQNAKMCDGTAEFRFENCSQ